MQKHSEKKRKIPSWPDGLGDFLKFTLIKENIDTLNALNILANILHTSTSNIQVAGTKDKRAVTVQWCTIYRRRPHDIMRLNKFQYPPLIRVGDFEYVKESLRLGSLSGNHFDIILRNVTSPISDASHACQSLANSGFINYFGLQRFGRGGTSSHMIGKVQFQGKWSEAIDMLFVPRGGDKEDIKRAKELYAQGLYQDAKAILPVQMSAEKKVLSYLCQKKNDYFGAYECISKSVRLLCAHAYQSYLWNQVASARIQQYGLVCVEGDIVSLNPKLIDDTFIDDVIMNEDQIHENVSLDDPITATQTMPITDENSCSSSKSSKFQTNNIHVVTADDVRNTTYSIRDVLLPLVGYDVILPTNSIGDLYESLLRADDLSLQHFKDKVPVQYRMKGVYRRLLQHPNDFEWNVISYTREDEELLSTELDHLVDSRNTKLNKDNNKEVDSTHNVITHTEATQVDYKDLEIDTRENQSNRKNLIALHLKFTLPPGTYATMLLREVTKQSTESQFHSQLTAASNISGEIQYTTNIESNSQAPRLENAIVESTEIETENC